MDDRKQKETSYHDKVRDKNLEQKEYFTSNKKFYSITRKSVEFIDKFLIEKGKGKRVLDYCSGDGLTTIFLAENGIGEAVGIDISPTSVENAKMEASLKGLNNARFFVMDAEKMDFEDNYFDIIICRGVLHHLDVVKAYPELARVLRPDGIVIAAEPLIYNPIFHLYRKRTPQLRTEWETDHILSKREINLAKKSFNSFEAKFYHLAVLLAVPFRKTFLFKPLLSILEAIDWFILKIPGFRWWAWQVVFILKDPKKSRKS